MSKHHRTHKKSNDSKSDSSDHKYKKRYCKNKKWCGCQNGENGQNGQNGRDGERGPAGPAGVLLGGADFYALMPGDNSATVDPATAVQFPNDGPNMNTNIVRAGPSSFTLKAIGFYQITFQVSVSEAGQLAVALGGVIQPYTVVGRATGTCQIVGTCIVQTTVTNTVLSIINPAGNSTALTITPLAGGASNVSAHLVILQLA